MRLDPISGLKGLFNVREKNDPEAVKPFLDHLEDLRWVVIKIVATLMTGTIVSFSFCDRITKLLQRPLDQFPPEQRKLLLRIDAIPDAFMISLTFAFYSGLILTLPIMLYFVAQFVLPALTKREKKLVLPAIAVGFLLFVVGVVFCFNFVLPRAVKFFFDYGKQMDWTPNWSVTKYFSFVSRMEMAFGAAFELPAIVLLLVFFDVLSFEFLKRTRAYGIVLILVLAMVIAPTPDVVTFLSLGAPMCLLYEGCIWLAWVIEWKKRKREAAAADSAEL